MTIQLFSWSRHVFQSPLGLRADSECGEQVGDMEEDHGYWGRAEDMAAAGLRRPAFVINATHPGSDLAAQAAAALAATAKVRDQ